MINSNRHERFSIFHEQHHYLHESLTQCRKMCNEKFFYKIFVHKSNKNDQIQFDYEMIEFRFFEIEYIR